MANPLALKALRLAGKGLKSVVKKLKSKKKDGLNSFKNLKQKRDYLKETSPMGRLEKNWPLKVPKETKYLHKKMDATAKKYGDGKQFYRSNSSVAGLAPVAGMPDRSNVKNKSSNMKIDLKKVK